VSAWDHGAQDFEEKDRVLGILHASEAYERHAGAAVVDQEEGVFQIAEQHRVCEREAEEGLGLGQVVDNEK
jgi:hypothetical protein